MFRFFATLARYSDNITMTVREIFKWLSTPILFLLVFEVTMRYIFRAPTIWGMDVCLYMSAAQRCIGLGYASMLHNHIAMDLFTAKIKSFRIARAIELFGYVVYHLPLLYFLAQATLNKGLFTFSRMEKMYSSWRPYLYPLLFFIFGAYCLLIMQILAESIKCVIHMLKGNDTWMKEVGLRSYQPGRGGG